MGTDTDITRPQKETLAEASVSPLHTRESDDLADEDISQLLNGAKAVTGKGVWSANGAAAAQREGAHQRQQTEEKQETKSREALELAHLAEWNAQKTTLGGVEMTNEEAQKARQHIIDNEDYYANRAVRDGRIREDEQDDYKRAARRIRDLEDRKGRGIATDADRRECERLQHSRPGRAAEGDAGAYHAQTSEQTLGVKAKSDTANADLRTGMSAAPASDIFKSAPDLNSHFSGAVTGVVVPKDMPLPDASIRSVKQVAFAPE